MEAVALVTDSSACLPAGAAQALGVRVLPITVHLPGADLPDDDVDLPQRVYQAVQRDEPVKSSPPSVAEYLAIVEEAAADVVVVVTPAVEFTSMHAHAVVASGLAARRVVAVDSRSAAAGQGLVVQAGAEAARAGAPLGTVLAAIEEASSRVDLVASASVLEPLRRSGRVPGVSPAGAEEGRTVFRMRQGLVERVAGARSAAGAMRAVEDEWAAHGGPQAGAAVVFHADCEPLALGLARRLGTEVAPVRCSAAMGLHTGPGVVGVAWLA